MTTERKRELIEMVSDALDELRSILDAEPDTPVNNAVGSYIEMRNRLSEVRKIYTTFEDFVKTKQDVLSIYLCSVADDTGVDSFKTAHGTAFRKIKESFRVEDFDSFMEWMIETGNTHCVEKRAAKMSVLEVFNETGETPPGLNYVKEFEFQFRKN